MEVGNSYIKIHGNFLAPEELNHCCLIFYWISFIRTGSESHRVAEKT